MSNTLRTAAALGIALGTGWGAHVVVSAPEAPQTSARASTMTDAMELEPARFSCPDRPGRAEGAERAGELVLEYLLTGDPARCEQAITQYSAEESSDYYGSESDSLAWFCRYVLAAPAERTKLEENLDGARFVRLFSPDNWARLRTHLESRFGYGASAGPSPDSQFNDEFLRFNSPLRAEKDHVDQVMALLALKPGDVVGDIGAGAGFYAFRFANAVGPTGKVHAVELNPLDIAYMRQVARDESIANLEVVVGSERAVGLGPASADVLFLSSTFHTIYGRAPAAVRQSFVESMKAALKPGGRVVIVENTPPDELPAGQLNPYVGFTISKKLLVDYLGTRGFQLLQDEQMVPQRYLLSWNLSKPVHP